MKTICLFVVAICTTPAAFSQIYISPGATLHLSDKALLTLKATDFINDGTVSASGTGRIIFNSSSNNNISGSTIPTFAEIEIAKTGSGLLTLQTDINVTGKVVFTSNLVVLNNYNINLGSTGILEGENENSRISGTGGGTVFLSATLNSPSAINPGNLGAVITSTKNLGNTIIRRGHTSQTTSGSGDSSIHRYFDITPTNNTGLNATLRINYFDAENNSLNENAFEIRKSSDNVTWKNAGYSGRDALANYVEKTGLNDFSRWTLSPNGATPVTVLQLTGKWENNATQLNWITQAEFNNSHFIVERKYRNEPGFKTIGRKNAAQADGNSQIATHYNWTDFAGNNQGPVEYRLQQKDVNGRTSYSNSIVIEHEPSSSFIVNMYPSVSVKNQVYLQTGKKNLREMQVIIYDMKGSLLLNKKLNYQSQWLTLPLMSAGVYKIFIRSGVFKWVSSFVKE